MPSPRPVKPRPSVVVALTETRSASTARHRAILARMAAAWVKVSDRVPLRPDEAGDARKQRLAVRPPVGRVRVREMGPDVAQGERAQKRVTDGVQQHVRVAVPQQSFFMGYFHAADDAVAARYQFMNVKTGADS